MNIIVLGPQGSGKGTQAELLAKKYNLEHIDMGKFLRVVAKENTPLGKKINEIINVRKELVDDKILKRVLHVKLQDLPREKGIVFDGVPRREDQREYFEEALREFGREIDAVIFVNIPKEESIKRISKRWTCKKCGAPLIMGIDIKNGKEKCPRCGGEIHQRADDSPEGVKKRLAIFKKETKPVIDYYRGKGLLIEIDGRPEIDVVSKNIIKELSKCSAIKG